MQRFRLDLRKVTLLILIALGHPLEGPPLTVPLNNYIQNIMAP